MSKPINHEFSALAQQMRDGAASYELRAGGATSSLSAHIVQQMPLLSSEALILDNACGTGVVTADLLAKYPSAKIEAVDASPPMIEIINNKIQATQSWNNRVTAKVSDGQKLDLESDRYDLSVTNCGIFFFADADVGGREIYRTLKPGGTACVTCWKWSALSDIFKAVQAIIEPAQPVGDSPVFEKWAKPETMEGTLTRAGFKNIKMHEKEVAMAWSSDADFVKAMTINMLGIAGTAWTSQEKDKIPEALKKLSAEQPALFLVPAGFEGKGSKQVAFVAFVVK